MGRPTASLLLEGVWGSPKARASIAVGLSLSFLQWLNLDDLVLLEALGILGRFQDHDHSPPITSCDPQPVLGFISPMMALAHW